MSRTKKADHRLVQPQDKDYKELDGKRYLVGPYTIEQRQKFIDIQRELALVRHPNLKGRDLKEAAFHKWRNLVFATLELEYKMNMPKEKK